MIVTIANMKGGVGKTATVAAVCAGMKRRGLKTLLVDMDPQSNATLLSHASGNGMFAMLTGQKDIHDAIVHTETMGDVIPSTRALGKLLAKICYEHDNHNVEGYETILKNQLDKVKDEYDFIFIDTPRSIELEYELVIALVATESVIGVGMCDALSVSGLTDLYDLITSVKAKYNPSLRIEGYLPSRVGKISNNEKRFRKKHGDYISTNLGAPLFDFSIRASYNVEAAANEAKNMYEYNDRAGIIDDYERLIDELLKIKERSAQ